MTIVNAHYFDTVHIIGDLTIDGEDITGLTITADRSLGNSVTITSMANTDACYFTDITVSGALTGQTRFTTCVLGALTGYAGGSKDCLLTGDIDIVGTGANYFTNCDTYVTAADAPKELNFNGHLVNIIRCRGSYQVNTKTDASVSAIDLVAGDIVIDSTCTAGIIGLSGMFRVTDNSGAGCEVLEVAVTTPATIWDEPIADHTEVGSTGLALGTASSGGVDYNALADAVWDEDLSTHNTADSAGEQVQKLRKLESNKAVISEDGLTVDIYDDDNVTIIHTYSISSDKRIRTPA